MLKPLARTHGDFMFDFIKSFFSPVMKNDSFVFDNNLQAFQMACVYLTSSLKVGVIAPAIVLDGRQYMHWASATETLEDGKQCLIVSVASSSGERTCTAVTRGQGEALEVGDLVAFSLTKRSSVIKREDIWSGVVLAKLDHAYISGKWRVKCLYE